MKTAAELYDSVFENPQMITRERAIAFMEEYAQQPQEEAKVEPLLGSEVFKAPVPDGFRIDYMPSPTLPKSRAVLLIHPDLIPEPPKKEGGDEWINVLNPPKYSGEYLCRMRDGYVKMCYWTGVEWRDMWQTTLKGVVKTWMFLPNFITEPPKVEDSNHPQGYKLRRDESIRRISGMPI